MNQKMVFRTTGQIILLEAAMLLQQNDDPAVSALAEKILSAARSMEE